MVIAANSPASRGAGGGADRDRRRDAPGGLHPATPNPGVSYRPYLKSGALRQMHGLPEQAFKLVFCLVGRQGVEP